MSRFRIAGICRRMAVAVCLIVIALQGAFATESVSGKARIRPIAHERIALKGLYCIFGDEKTVMTPGNTYEVQVGGVIHADVSVADPSFEVNRICLERKDGAFRKEIKAVPSSPDSFDADKHFVLDVPESGEYRLVLSARRIVKRNIVFPKQNLGINDVRIFIGDEPVDCFSWGDSYETGISGDVRMLFEIRNGYALRPAAGAERNRNEIIIGEDKLRGLGRVDLNRYFEIEDHTCVPVSMEIDGRLRDMLSVSYDIDYILSDAHPRSFDALDGSYKVGDRININWSVRNQGDHGGFMALYRKAPADEHQSDMTAMFAGGIIGLAVRRIPDLLEENRVISTQKLAGDLISISPIRHGGGSIVVDESESIALALKPVEAEALDGSMIATADAEMFSVCFDPDFIVGGFPVRDYLSFGFVPIGNVRFRIMMKEGFSVKIRSRIWMICDEEFSNGKEIMLDTGKWKKSGKTLKGFLIDSIEGREVFKKVE